MSHMSYILLALLACAVLSNLFLFYFTMAPHHQGSATSSDNKNTILYSNISSTNDLPPNYNEFVDSLRQDSSSKTFLVFMTPLIGRPKEHLAIRTWMLLQQYLRFGGAELLVLGLMERPENKDPEVLDQSQLPQTDAFRFIYVNVVHCINSEYNVPEIGCIIHSGMDFTKEYLKHFKIDSKIMYLFVNSDIFFSPALAYTFNSFVKSHGDSFVAFGQRTDVEKQYLERGSPQDLINRVNNVSKSFGQHNSHPYAIDYFIFSESSFPKNYPSYLVGVYRWDNHLALEFILSSSQHKPTIDTTSAIPCLHEGVFDTQTAYHKKRVKVAIYTTTTTIITTNNNNINTILYMMV